jgi:putative transposase
MTNHVHLLISPHSEQSLAKLMQMVGRYYVQYFNYSYQRTGTLWEGRYKSTPVDSERYLLTCYRYIELNPVRAVDMAEQPQDYPWSSYRFNALGMENALITPHDEYMKLANSATQRQQAYRELFLHHIAAKTLDEIRQATNKSWVLGSQHFKDKIELQLNRSISPKAKGGDRKLAAYRNSLKINRV